MCVVELCRHVETCGASEKWTAEAWGWCKGQQDQSRRSRADDPGPGSQYCPL